MQLGRHEQLDFYDYDIANIYLPWIRISLESLITHGSFMGLCLNLLVLDMPDQSVKTKWERQLNVTHMNRQGERKMKKIIWVL